MPGTINFLGFIPANYSIGSIDYKFLLEGGLIHKIIRSNTESGSNLLDCVNARFTLVGFDIADRTVRHRSPMRQLSHAHVLGGA